MGRLRSTRRAVLGAMAGLLIAPSPMSAAPPSVPRGAERRIAAFPDTASVEGWRPIDDRVMGGRSRSSATWSRDEALVFSGELSLEQGGGFASLRRELGSADLGGSTGLRLVVRGDGRDYRINLRDRALAMAADEGTQHRALFRADGSWAVRWLPWSAFVASRRGRLAVDAPPLDIRSIASVGLMTAFRDPGPFRLEVRSIEAA